MPIFESAPITPAPTASCGALLKTARMANCPRSASAPPVVSSDGCFTASSNERYRPSAESDVWTSGRIRRPDATSPRYSDPRFERRVGAYRILSTTLSSGLSGGVSNMRPWTVRGERANSMAPAASSFSPESSPPVSLPIQPGLSSAEATASCWRWNARMTSGDASRAMSRGVGSPFWVRRTCASNVRSCCRSAPTMASGSIPSGTSTRP